MHTVVVGGHLVLMIPLFDSLLNFVFVVTYATKHVLPLYLVFAKLHNILGVLFLNFNLISISISNMLLCLSIVFLNLRVLHLLIHWLFLILSALCCAISSELV